MQKKPEQVNMHLLESSRRAEQVHMHLLEISRRAEQVNIHLYRQKRKKQVNIYLLGDIAFWGWFGDWCPQLAVFGSSWYPVVTGRPACALRRHAAESGNYDDDGEGWA